MTRTTFPRISSVLARARDVLASPRVPLLAALLAAGLTLPSLFAGFATEDWIQRGLVRSGFYPLPRNINLFGHGPLWSTNDVMKRDWGYQLSGWFPWVTDRTFDTSFWRPLASLTHHFDYRLFPDRPWLMHAESILWYAALAAVVTLLHRRLVEPRWVAGLASVLYAADDAHGHPVGWLINRNGLMATFFAVLALWAYDRFRREGWRAGAVLTPLLLGLGLCSAEFALCSAGYFLAYGVFVDPAPIGRRLAAASTWVLTLLGWALAYRALGHVSRGSGLYIDPIADPMNYVFELFERGTVLLMGQLGAPFADTWTHANPYAQGFIVFWAATMISFVAYTAWPLFLRDRFARFWAAGLVLSLPPACATFPEDRLLLLAGIGAFPLVAMFVGMLADPTLVPVTRRAPALALAAGWFGLHCVVGPLLLPYRSLRMYEYDSEVRAAGRSAFSHVTGTPGESLIVVDSENYYFAGMMAMTRSARHEPTVARMLTLAGTLDDVALRRIDAEHIEVRPKYGFFSRVFNRIYRSRSMPFARGSSVDLLGVTVTVSEIDQWGEPLTAVFGFALPLENARYHWIAWRNGHYESFD